jgi:hypothetical protein
MRRLAELSEVRDRLGAALTLRRFGQALLLVAGIAAAGLALLVATDSLVSMPAVADRLADAAARRQLGNASAMERTLGFTQSYFSECIGLSAAGSPARADPDFTIRSRVVLWRPGTNICDSAASAMRDPAAVAWFDYSRYWHGYRVLLFPLVEAFGLRGAQGASGALMIVSACLLFVLLIPVAGWSGSLAAFAVLMGLSGLPLVYVTPTHAISLSMVLWAAATMLLVSPGRSDGGLLLLAAGLGAAYNFVDFLYNPGAMAMMVGGAFILVVGRDREPTTGDAAMAGALALATLAGYGAMWTVKWLASVPGYFFGAADFPILPADFGRWMAGLSGGYLPLRASARLVATTFGGVVAGSLLLVGLALIGVLAHRHPRAVGGRLLAMAVPTLVGMATIEAMAGHSIAHGPFTFRIVAFAAALLSLAAAQGWVKARDGSAGAAGPVRRRSASAARGERQDEAAHRSGVG